jgi:hypothetical protein
LRNYDLKLYDFCFLKNIKKQLGWAAIAEGNAMHPKALFFSEENV